MRTGVALSVLVSEVRTLGRVSSVQTTYDDTIKYMLNAEQRSLVQKLNWPHLSDEVDLTIVADQEIYTLPAAINRAQIRDVQASFSDEWVPVTHGIGRRQRSAFPSGNASYPPQRYELQPDDGSGTYTFELWPKPSDAGTLRFTATVPVTDMVDDSDVCLIAADALVWVTSAQILARNKQDDAAYWRNRGLKHAAQILGGLTTDVEEPISHLPRARRNYVPGIDYIPPRSD